MNHANLPNDPKVAAKVVDAQAATEQAKLNRGIVGWIIGGRESVPHNTAFLVIAACLGMLLCLLLDDGGYSQNKDAIAVVTPLLTLFGGYLFGKGGKD